MGKEKKLSEKKQKKVQEAKKPKSVGDNIVHFPPKLIGLLAEEVSKTVVERLPSLIPKQKKKNKVEKKIEENAFFFDTSAIIDGRVFNIVETGLIAGPCIVLEKILLELKHIADSQDAVKRERGRKGLELLEKLKKTKHIKLIILPQNEVRNVKAEDNEVDEELLKTAKQKKGRVITCDFNLAKKASIQNVLAININALANFLKVTAVPGESLHVSVLHRGKDPTQGVGYLDDGTMIVVENGSDSLEKTIDVVVSRVIQTQAGRILFAKKI